ncbi:Uncharacterized protein HZ326_25805 [Fusarium oxysporum f. sp. albedinis]|nr:Uncharacterized protein HZ326_25805 [Fusarium oxysporum f. sp. albedinis]
MWVGDGRGSSVDPPPDNPGQERGDWSGKRLSDPLRGPNYSRAPDSPRITSHRIVLLLSSTVALEFGHGRQICMTMAQESRI